ncbi:hypothetical protein E2C01_033027 [Portunus trituberculatus]|uniref:Uncharacterized protein n=1 Tax=Portunus trituberculatus TaxID=210409 RepID=A0A5B7EWR3_PORTR|nr:hypothetical protein [Portunus trituberculatus]
MWRGVSGAWGGAAGRGESWRYMMGERGSHEVPWRLSLLPACLPACVPAIAITPIIRHSRPPLARGRGPLSSPPQKAGPAGQAWRE